MKNSKWNKWKFKVVTTPVENHIAVIDGLLEEFVMANSPIYKVSVLDSKYHVVNMRTNITHTVWPTMDSAMQSMRDLNRFAKRVA